MAFLLQHVEVLESSPLRSEFKCAFSLIFSEHGVRCFYCGPAQAAAAAAALRVKVFTGPVDGDGRGVDADGHGSLLQLEELSRVSGPLGDDGLRLLEAHG